MGPPGCGHHPRQWDPLGGGCKGAAPPLVQCPCSVQGEPAHCTPPMGAGEQQDRQELPAVQAGQPHMGPRGCWGPATHPGTRVLCLPTGLQGLGSPVLAQGSDPVDPWPPHRASGAVAQQGRVQGSCHHQEVPALPRAQPVLCPHPALSAYEQPIPGARHGTATHRRPAGAPWPGAARRAT